MKQLLLFILLFCSISLFASSSKDEYHKGLKAYQEKEYEKAKDHFSLALKENPQNKSLLLNLGLSQFQLGLKGHAVANWRKALLISPGYKPAKKALDFALGKENAFASSDPDSSWESFRYGFLVHYSLDQFLFTSAFFLIIGGWLLIRYFGKRKASLNEEKPLPPFPTVGLIIFLAFVLSIGITAAKAWDLIHPRATVVAEVVPVRTAPDQNSNTLFELVQGNEVIMESSTKNWMQITYPGGMTGWVPSETLVKTYGRKLW